MPHSPDLDRLAAEVLQVGFGGTTAPDWLLRQLAEGLGGVVLFARNVPPDGAAGLITRLRSERPEVIVAVDEEGGSVTRLQAVSGSSWPGNAALGAVDDEDVTERTAAEIGRMLAATGITLDYAPDADVNADPANPVIGIRSFGAFAGLVARHTAAWVRGLQSAGVAACAKHFPGHGDTITDSHLALPTVHASRELLERRDLPPFRAAVAAGARAVMCGHLLVPALDPELPASLSRRVLTGLLREELGFTGMVVTDAIEMRAVAAVYPPERIAVLALAAGADAICAGITSPGGESVTALRAGIVRAVHDGSLPEERLAEAASRVRALSHRHAESPGGTDGFDVTDGHGFGVSRLGLETARQALRVTPAGVARPVLAVAPLVVRMTVRPHQAIGEVVQYGPGEALGERLAGTRTVDLHQGDELPVLPEDRPVVIVTHDAHRHTWMRDVLAEALRRCPGAVVVETGLPGPARGAVYLATHGDSRVSALAAADWLTTS
ncbi:glycoside hydrolase family 3 protein [Sphaerisporangium rubeum]|uniref:Beta-N-acetylhexosaminidase n=1 Tax=Sphaerisporangium rubeum TaxID=321317 RepID=A0A7X0IDG6_9ACTN|nr:glycoside hydrolase family 3 protein [Sphaerisporangium rubeum]MBB6473234.1 beta-N-acetylhexosaminidase [Sphaerisporangium rubeum]